MKCQVSFYTRLHGLLGRYPVGKTFLLCPYRLFGHLLYPLENASIPDLRVLDYRLSSKLVRMAESTTNLDRDPPILL